MASHTSRRHHMRCNACRRKYRKVGARGGYSDASARFVLRRHPSEYKRTVRCPTCRSDDVTSVQHIHERMMAKRKAAGLICRCLPFPHERGTIAGCEHWPGTGDAQSDYEAAEAVMNTRRGSFT